MESYKAKEYEIFISEKKLYSYEDWKQFPFEVVVASKTTEICKIILPDNFPIVYAKIYTCPTLKHLRKQLMRGGLVGKTRAKIEFENLKLLHKRSLAPKVIMFKENRSLGFFQSAFLVMEEVKGAIPLDVFVFTKLNTLNRESRFLFIKSLAEVTKIMNEKRYVNGEYHWRNILVCKKNNTWQFQIIDPSSRRFRDKIFKPYFDLATLDVYSEKFFSKIERLRFLKFYFGKSGSFSQKEKKLIAKIEKLRDKIKRKELKRYESVYRSVIFKK